MQDDVKKAFFLIEKHLPFCFIGSDLDVACKTLKAAVLAQQTTNKQSTPCDECSHWVTMCEHQVKYGSHDCKVLRR